MPELAIKPRHVLCFLGPKGSMKKIVAAAARGARAGFEVDHDYSIAEADPRMETSFAVCWDRVACGAWTSADERAVSAHGAVVYVLSPRMTAKTAVDVSLDALDLVAHVLGKGATAAKGESAGVAHGVQRWRALAAKAAKAREAGDRDEQTRVARLAFAKRPLEGDGVYESVGFHLVGLPDVHVRSAKLGGAAAAKAIDAIADDMASLGVKAALKKHRLTLSKRSDYEKDSFKYNPFGTAKPK
jgi:hypothetical protein